MKTIYYHLLIDASKSMQPHWDGLIKQLMKHLKKNNQLEMKYGLEIKTSCCAFNTEQTFIDLDNVSLASLNAVEPKGLTALYDAIVANINHVEKAVFTIGNSFENYIVFIIITDGHENASTLFNAKQARELIVKLQQQGNWDFIFFGADLDVREINKVLEIPNFKYHNFDKSEIKLAFLELDQIILQTFEAIVDKTI